MDDAVTDAIEQVDNASKRRFLRAFITAVFGSAAVAPATGWIGGNQATEDRFTRVERRSKEADDALDIKREQLAESLVRIIDVKIAEERKVNRERAIELRGRIQKVEIELEKLRA